MSTATPATADALREQARAALVCSHDNFAVHGDVASVLRAGSSRDGEAPLVSIVIPTYRRPAMLRQALRSALNQEGFDDYEIVIVDNDPDGDQVFAAELAGFAGDRAVSYFVNERNLGMTGNWNRGLELARGTWVSFLHDDDWLAPRFLAEATRRLDEDVALMACEVLAGDLDYEPTALPCAASPEAYELDRSDYIGGNVTPAPGILARRALLMQIGGFDDDYYPCSDYVAYVRTALRGRTLRLRRRLAYYRTSDSTTYKGDTLLRMMRFSRAFKLVLLEEAPSLRSRLAYVQSMAYWCATAVQHGVAASPEFHGPLDRAAAVLGRSRTLRAGLSVLRRLAFPPRISS